MGQVIHARKTSQGEYTYRIWSTISDSYLTESLTESQTMEYLLREEVQHAITTHLMDNPVRIDRAKKLGTSQYPLGRGAGRDIEGSWEKERQD